MASTHPTSTHEWNLVIRDLGPGLLRYFRTMFPRHVAADMVQEVFLRLVVNVRAGKFQASAGTLRMYAYGIARYVRLEGRRSEIQPGASVDPDSLPLPSVNADDDAREQLRAAIRQLKAIEQEIILLLLDKDLTTAAIGQLLQIPEGTIKSHVHRAKAALKNLLLPNAERKEGHHG